ncbi:MAG: DHHA1 domain-containing protein, partial [Actinomycetota bacterium]
EPNLKKYLDLVALGTIADVVPLTGENRSLVKRGLSQMSRTGRPGLRALMEVGQVDPSRLNAGLVAFRLAPRLNAAGRLEDPEPALKLLVAESNEEAAELAGHLDSLNRERQKIENQMLAEAEALIGHLPEEQKQKRGYVVSSPDWHEGVIGIVASRMVEMHHRPVFMISESGSHGKGSGRSIPAFDLHRSLVDLNRLFESFGGHRNACGLTIRADKIEEFKREFADYADAQLTEADLHPSRYVDALASGRELTLELTEELARMEPFGLGNPSIELLAIGARLHNGRKTRNGLHFQCQVETGGARSSAIGFRQAFLEDKLGDASNWDVVFRLEQNEFNGSVSPQLNLREVFPLPAQGEPAPGMCESRCYYDCPDRIRGDEFWALVVEGAGLPEVCTNGNDATGPG